MRDGDGNPDLVAEALELCFLKLDPAAVAAASIVFLQRRIDSTADMAVSLSTPTLTCCGSPVGRHSRPAFLKSPTSFFFFASTDMTGLPAARFSSRTDSAAESRFDTFATYIRSGNLQGVPTDKHTNRTKRLGAAWDSGSRLVSARPRRHATAIRGRGRRRAGRSPTKRLSHDDSPSYHFRVLQGRAPAYDQ